MIGGFVVTQSFIDDIMFQMTEETLDMLTPKQKETAPPLKGHYSEWKWDGKKMIAVNGHFQRFKALNDAWYKRFEIDDSLRPIAVVDLAPEGSMISLRLIKDHDWPDDFEQLSMVVEITDVPVLAWTTADIIINYQIGTSANDYEGLPGKKLLGKNYFFAGTEENWVDGFVSSDKPNVIVIPNGDKEKFFSELDIELLHRTVAINHGGSVTIVNNLDKNTLVDYLDMASIVVTTPSITAMECLMIGLPVLLVETSDDQTGKFVQYGLADWYSPQALAYLVNMKSARTAVSENGKQQIQNNIDAVIDIIYNTWKEKQQ